MIEFTIKTLESKNHGFSVEDETTVAELKELIRSEMGIAIELQRLIFCGRVLTDEKRLSELKVDGKVIHLVPRPPPLQSTRNTPASTSSNVRHDLQNAIEDAQRAVDRISNQLNRQGRRRQQLTLDPASDLFIDENLITSLSATAGRLEFVRRTIEDIRGSMLALHAHICHEDNGETVRDHVEPMDIDTPLSSELPSSETTAAPQEPEVFRNGLYGDVPALLLSPHRRRSPRPVRPIMSRPQDVARMIEELDRFHVEFSPFRFYYLRILRDRNEARLSPEDRRHRQNVIELICDVMHSFAHAYHALSDISLEMAGTYPRLAIGYSTNRSQQPLQGQINVMQRRPREIRIANAPVVAPPRPPVHITVPLGEVIPYRTLYANTGTGVTGASTLPAGISTLPPGVPAPPPGFTAPPPGYPTSPPAYPAPPPAATANVGQPVELQPGTGTNTHPPAQNHPEPITYQVDIETRVPIALPIDTALLDGLAAVASNLHHGHFRSQINQGNQGPGEDQSMGEEQGQAQSQSQAQSQGQGEGPEQAANQTSQPRVLADIENILRTLSQAHPGVEVVMSMEEIHPFPAPPPPTQPPNMINQPGRMEGQTFGPVPPTPGARPGTYNTTFRSGPNAGGENVGLNIGTNYGTSAGSYFWAPTGPGAAMHVHNSAPAGAGMYVHTGAPTGAGMHVHTSAPTGAGMYIHTGAPTGAGMHVHTSAPTGAGMHVHTSAPTGAGMHVHTSAPTGAGMHVHNSAPTGAGMHIHTSGPTGAGMHGHTSGPAGAGMYVHNSAPSGVAMHVLNNARTGAAMQGHNNARTGTARTGSSMHGYNNAPPGAAMHAHNNARSGAASRGHNNAPPGATMLGNNNASSGAAMHGRNNTQMGGVILGHNIAPAGVPMHIPNQAPTGVPMHVHTGAPTDAGTGGQAGAVPGYPGSLGYGGPGYGASGYYGTQFGPLPVPYIDHTMTEYTYGTDGIPVYAPGVRVTSIHPDGITVHEGGVFVPSYPQIPDMTAYGYPPDFFRDVVRDVARQQQELHMAFNTPNATSVSGSTTTSNARTANTGTANTGTLPSASTGTGHANSGTRPANTGTSFTTTTTAATVTITATPINAAMHINEQPSASGSTSDWSWGMGFGVNDILDGIPSVAQGGQERLERLSSMARARTLNQADQRRRNTNSGPERNRLSSSRAHHIAVANMVYDRFLNCDSVHGRNRISERRSRYQDLHSDQLRRRASGLSALDIDRLRFRNTNFTTQHMVTMMRLLSSRVSTVGACNAFMVTIARVVYLSSVNYPVEPNTEIMSMPREYILVRIQMRQYIIRLGNAARAYGVSGRSPADVVATILLTRQEDFLNRLAHHATISPSADPISLLRDFLRRRMPSIIAFILCETTSEITVQAFYHTFMRFFIDLCRLVLGFCVGGVQEYRVLFMAFIDHVTESAEATARDWVRFLSLQILNATQTEVVSGISTAGNPIALQNAPTGLRIRAPLPFSLRRSFSQPTTSQTTTSQSMSSEPMSSEPTTSHHVQMQLEMSEDLPETPDTPDLPDTLEYVPTRCTSSEDSGSTPPPEQDEEQESEEAPVAAAAKQASRVADDTASTASHPSLERSSPIETQSVEASPRIGSPIPDDEIGMQDEARALPLPETSCAPHSPEPIQIDEDRALPQPETTSVPISSDPIHFVTPVMLLEHWGEEWVPVFTADQRLQTENDRPQEPHSDAYLSGMPSRKRRCVRASRPPTSLEGFINESLREATDLPAPLDPSEIRTVLRDSVRTLVQTRAEASDDFDPARYTATARFIEQAKTTDSEKVSEDKSETKTETKSEQESGKLE